VEVQGIRARRALGADPAARPDGRVPPRLPLPLADDAAAALHALPARRRRGLGVLLRDDPGGLARDAPGGAADPEDALPPSADRVRGRRDEPRHVCRDARDPPRRLLRVHPGIADEGMGRAAALGAAGRAGCGARAHPRVRERDLPGRGARRGCAAAAVVLPHAGHLLAVAVPPPRAHAVLRYANPITPPLEAIRAPLLGTWP